MRIGNIRVTRLSVNLDGCTHCPAIYHLAGFARSRLRRRKPGPPPFTSTNSQPRLHHHAAWLYALLFLGGSSSPFIGGLPIPVRLRTFRAFGISARAARPGREAAVRRAERFSATATLISWLSATPSASASLRSSSMSGARHKTNIDDIVKEMVAVWLSWLNGTGRL